MFTRSAESLSGPGQLISNCEIPFSLPYLKKFLKEKLESGGK